MAVVVYKPRRFGYVVLQHVRLLESNMYSCHLELSPICSLKCDRSFVGTAQQQTRKSRLVFLQGCQPSLALAISYIKFLCHSFFCHLVRVGGWKPYSARVHIFRDKCMKLLHNTQRHVSTSYDLQTCGTNTKKKKLNYCSVVFANFRHSTR
jgi:hypothetical protein